MDHRAKTKDALRHFLSDNPHINPPPATVAALTRDFPEEIKRYRAYLVSLDPERYKAARQRAEEKRRDKRAEYNKARRTANGDRVREIEKRYRESKKGRATRSAYEKKPHVKERRRQYRQQHPEVQRAAAQRYRERYLEKERTRVREFLRKYRQTDKYQQYREEHLKTPGYRWVCVQTSARARNLEVTITKEDVEIMSTQPCYYCGDDPKDLGVLFGIDRVDSTLGYTKDNVQTCCTFCNMAKKDYHIDDFIRGMCNVGANLLEDTTWMFDYNFTDATKQRVPCEFSDYVSSAKRREVDFHLNEDEFHAVVAEDCFYCKCPAPNGVDRVDNSLGYDTDNVVPACSQCNYAKRDWDLDIFWTKAKAIFLKWRDIKMG